MSKSGRKISGFFKAMLLAIVSFFVIFLFFSDISEKLFGTSIKGSPKIAQKAGEMLEDAKEATEAVKNTFYTVDSTINKLNTDTDGGK